MVLFFYTYSLDHRVVSPCRFCIERCLSAGAPERAEGAQRLSTPDERQELREQLNLYYEKWLHIDNLYNAWSQQFGLSYISLLTLYMVRSAELLM